MAVGSRDHRGSRDHMGSRDRADFYRFMLILPVWALLPFYAKTRSLLPNPHPMALPRAAPVRDSAVARPRVSHFGPGRVRRADEERASSDPHKLSEGPAEQSDPSTAVYKAPVYCPAQAHENVLVASRVRSCGGRCLCSWSS